MAKPVHKVRLPPPAAAAFVGLGDAPGATKLPETAKPAVQPASPSAVLPAASEEGQTSNKRRVEVRRDGRELRKQTLYLPNHLYRKLRLYVAEHDADMSEVAVEALEAFLSSRQRNELSKDR